MNLRDVRADEFQARFERRLGQLGLPVVASADAINSAELTDRQRARAEFIAEQRQRLDQIFDPQKQIAAFDTAMQKPGLWASTFVRLGDIQSLPGSALEGERLQKHIWDSLQGRDVREFKRFQEIFCRPVDYVVPRFEVLHGRGTPLKFDSQARQACSSVLATIVAPDRISLPLCEHLRLYDPLTDKGDPWSRLLARAELAVQQSVKLIWDASTAFRSSGRVRVITLPSQALTRRYGANVPPISEEIVGKILISHEVPTPKGSIWFKRGIQFFADPHGSLRRAQHIDAGYEKEIEHTRRIEAELRSLSSRVDKEWSSASAEQRDALVNEARQTIGEAIETLGSPKNAKRVKARELLAAAIEFRDKRNRINPSAVLVRMSTAMKALGDRMTEAESKAGHVHHDGKEFFDEVARARAGIRLLGERIVNRVAPALPGLALFGRSLSERERPEQARLALTRFGLDPSAFGIVQRSPYDLIASQLAANYQTFATGLRSGNVREAQEGLVCMHIVVKFHEAYETLEQIKADIPALERRLATPGTGKAVLEELLARSSVLKLVFSERQILARHMVREEYARPFVQMRTRLQEIERGLRHYLDKKISEQEVGSMLRRFKLYLAQTAPLDYLRSRSRS
ncbi:MAG: hypothetical protein K1X79_01865 [Oligoflexia bacterium]|nr:hypothetical protein [Oligoflexia bacterium]